MKCGFAAKKIEPGKKGRRRTEDRGQRTEVRGQKTENF
jgi:hypothetical protein